MCIGIDGYKWPPSVRIGCMTLVLLAFKNSALNSALAAYAVTILKIAHVIVTFMRINTDFNIPKFLDIPDSWIYDHNFPEP